MGHHGAALTLVEIAISDVPSLPPLRELLRRVRPPGTREALGSKPYQSSGLTSHRCAVGAGPLHA